MIDNNNSDSRWLRYSIFVIVTSIALLLVSIVVVFGMMKRAGEFMDPVAILDQQRQTDGLYRSALTDDMMSPEFRIARYDALQPEIVALGSSRVLQFRQSHFTRPFANLGMSLDYALLPNIAQALIQKPNRLKMVLLDIDHWQVNDKVLLGTPDDSWSPRTRRLKSIRDYKIWLAELREQYIYGPLRLVWNGRIGIQEIRTILCHCDAGGPDNNLGLSALIDGSGVDTEGSYHYTWVFDKPKSGDGFSEFQRRINARESGFQILEKAAPLRVLYIERAIKILNDAGVEVVLFIPPLAPTVTRAMAKAGGYGVMEDLDRIFKNKRTPFYNFNDSMSTLQSPDCEFVDGQHGGEVTYLRILQAMARDSPQRWSGYVDPLKINEMIAKYSGHVNAYEAPRSGNRTRREVDFLGIGCKK